MLTRARRDAQVSCLHIAAKRADVRMLQTLVLLGADWQVADSDGATALHYAAMGAGEGDALRMASLLLELGVEVDRRDADGRRALDVASEKGDRRVADVLRRASAGETVSGGWGDFLRELKASSGAPAGGDEGSGGVVDGNKANGVEAGQEGLGQLKAETVEVVSKDDEQDASAWPGGEWDEDVEEAGFREVEIEREILRACDIARERGWAGDGPSALREGAGRGWAGDVAAAEAGANDVERWEAEWDDERVEELMMDESVPVLFGKYTVSA